MRATWQVFGVALAAAWLVALAAVGAVTAGPDPVVVVLLALAPLSACLVLGARGTATFAIAAAAAAVGAGWWDAAWGTVEHWVGVVDVALVGAVAVVIAFRRVRQEQHVTQLTLVAEAAQRAVLPRLPGVVRQVAARARYVSAAQDALIGGDLYDYVDAEEHARFLVADVRGKGITGIEQAARVIPRLD